MSNFILGKTICSVMIASDRKALLFKCTDGDHVVKVDGDCCSDSWVEHIEMPALGFPSLVTEVNELTLGQDDDGGDVIALYGCQIKTTKGEIVIDYRNSSNGYYGGNLSWPDDSHFYGGVYDQNVSNLNWVEVTE